MIKHTLSNFEEALTELKSSVSKMGGLTEKLCKDGLYAFISSNVDMVENCNEQDKIIDLEMHWEHDKDFLYHPDDPETIIQRLEFIKGKYYLNKRVKLTHVFNSTLFHYSDENQRHKVRFLFDSEHYHPIVNETPPNQPLEMSILLVKFYNNSNGLKAL